MIIYYQEIDPVKILFVYTLFKTTKDENKKTGFNSEYADSFLYSIFTDEKFLRFQDKNT